MRSGVGGGASSGGGIRVVADRESGGNLQDHPSVAIGLNANMV